MRLEIMDQSGHSIVELDNDANSMARAEERFRELTGVGFIAAVPTGNGEHKVIREFDPTATDMLFIPQYVGG